MRKKARGFKKILVPIDPLKPTKAGLLLAQKLAKKSRGQILIIAVVEPVFYTNVDYFAIPPGRSINRQIIEDTRIKTEDYVKSLKVKAQLFVSMGVPIVEILKFTKKQKVDLIMIAGEERGKVERFFLGSISEAVARKARCPVWVVKKRQRSINNITVPVNGHIGSLEALAEAARIARLTKWKITPISIVEERYISSFSLIDIKHYIKKLVKNRKGEVLKWIRKVPGLKKTQKPIVDYGNPRELIPEIAQKLKSGLIVISTHSKSGVAYTLMGRTATSILRRAPCSVLVMHPSDWKFKLI